MSRTGKARVGSRDGKRFSATSRARKRLNSLRDAAENWLFRSEPLERRLLLTSPIVLVDGAGSTTTDAGGTISVVGLPEWNSEGPGPITGGQVVGISKQAVTGAIQAVLVHPTDPNTLYVGTVGGGIWKTVQGNSAAPHWTPLTEQFPRTSFTTLVSGPSQAAGSPFTLYAGTGQVSSGLHGGRGIGILKSIDGGSKWRLIPGPFSGKTINKIVATSAVQGAGHVVFVAAENGLFKSTDGGNGRFRNLTKIASTGLPTLAAGNAVTDLIADPGNGSRPANGQVLYVAITGQGIYRTNDTGETWEPADDFSQDIAGASRVLLAVSAASAANGLHPVYAAVIKSVTGKLSAAGALMGSTTVVVQDSTLFEAKDTISIGTESGHTIVHVDRGTNTLHLEKALAGNHVANAIVSRGGNRLAGIYRSEEMGDFTTFLPLWSAMVLPRSIDILLFDANRNGVFENNASELIPEEYGTNPGGQAAKHFSIAADPGDPNIVYIGGDRQAETRAADLNGNGVIDGPNEVFNSAGLTNSVGRVFRGDASQAVPALQWYQVVGKPRPFVGGGASDSAPHADSRAMVFEASGNLLQLDDGGIYRLVDPSDNNADDGPGDTIQRHWESVNGDLTLAEFYSVAWNDELDLILGGAQDTGNSAQIGFDPKEWETLFQGDGAFVFASQGRLFYSYLNLQHFQIGDGVGGNPDPVAKLLVFDADGTPTNQTLQDFDRLVVHTKKHSTVRQLQLYAVNTIDPNRLLIGTSFLYESIGSDSELPGDKLHLLNGPVIPGFAGKPSFPAPLASVGQVGAIVYGGVDPDGAPRPDVVWVGTDGKPGTRQYLFVRQAGDLQPVAPVVSYPGVQVKDIAVDPQNWQHVYVLDANGNVWFSPNGGASPSSTVATDWNWQKLTGDLADLAGARKGLQQILVVHRSGQAPVLLAGGEGGLFRRSVDGVWSELGLGLPNVLVTDLDYSEADDVLLVGTWGRGAWTIRNASNVLDQSPVLRIIGTAGADVFRLERNPTEPWLLDVYHHLSTSPQPAIPDYQVPIASLQFIDVEGLGGDDLFIINSANGALTTPLPIAVDGGGGTNQLQIEKLGASGMNLVPGFLEIEATDPWGQVATQRVDFINVEDPVVTPVAATVDAFKAALKKTSEGSQRGLFDGLAQLNTAGLDGSSLFELISGTVIAVPRADEDLIFAGTQLSPDGPLQVNNGASILSRLIEEGLGAFSLDSIGSDGDIADPEALRQALDGLDTTNGNVTVEFDKDLDGDGISDASIFYHVQIDKTLSGILELGVGASLGGLGDVQLGGAMEVSVDVGLDLRFGMDDSGFFILPNASGMPTITLSRFSISGDVAGEGRLGFLGVQLADASLSLDPNIAIQVNLVDLVTDTDDVIRMGELNPSRFAELVEVSLAGTSPNGVDDLVLNATFVLAVVAPDAELSIPIAQVPVRLAWSDFGNPASLLAPANAATQAVLDFIDLAGDDVFGQLSQFQTTLDSLFSAPALDQPLPFAPDLSVKELVDASQAFADTVLAPLTSSAGGANFFTLQEMLGRLAGPLGLDLSNPNLITYNDVTGELALRLPVHYEFDPLTRTVQLDSIGGPGLDVNGINLQFDAALDLDFTFGFNLKSALPPVQTFFARVNSLSADVTARATGIGVSGDLGVMSFDLSNGAIVLGGDMTLTVGDPTPADNRLTGSDFQQILADPGQFGRILLNTEILAAGSVTAMLGDSQLNLSLQNGTFALGLFGTFDTQLATQAPATYALDARGTVTLGGLSNAFTLTGTGVARINTTGGAISELDIGRSGIDLVFAANEGNLSSFGVTGTITGTVDGVIDVSGSGIEVNLSSTPATLLSIASATVIFPGLGDDLAFHATNLTLGRDGSVGVGSASATGDNLLDRFGVGGFLPFDVNNVSITGIGGQPITLSRFQVHLAGTFDETVFENELADPVISVGGLDPTAGGDFTFVVQVQDGAVTFPSLNGDVTLGFANLALGPMTAGATLTLGRFDAGAYIFDIVGATGNLRVDADTSFSFSGKGRLTFPGGSARLALSPDVSDPTLGLRFDADFDTGPGGFAQLHVEDFHAELDLAIELDSQLHLINSHLQFLGASVGRVDVRLGEQGNEVLLFTADSTIPGGPAITLNLSDPALPFMTFSSLEATLPALAQIPGFNALRGTVRNFAIGQDFSFQPSASNDPNQRFGVEFTNLPTAQAFGLPDWFPVQVTGLGLEFGEGALTGETFNYIAILSGGLVSSDQFPISANVERLKINLGKLADFFDPNIPLAQQDLLGVIEDLGGFEVGVEPFSIGEALTIGGSLKLRLIQDDLNRNALVGTIAGYFEVAGFGGGVELTFSQVGPVMAKLDVPLGIPLGPTGLLLSGVSGGFRFGGPDFAPPQTPQDLLAAQTTFEPLHFDPAKLDMEIRRLLSTGQATWDQSFTVALAGEFTTVATPGILGGTLNLAAQIRPAPGGVPDISFLGSGDVTLWGLQVGAVGAILDFTNPLSPSFDLAFAVPSPLNPLGFLFPAQATFDLSLHTDGMIEAPLIGLHALVNQAVDRSLDLLLTQIADTLDADRARPFALLILQGEAPDVVITPAFLKSKLLSLLPQNAAALNALTPGEVNTRATLASAFMAELFNIGRTMTPEQWNEIFGDFTQVLADSARQALQDGWERFNPSFAASGLIQPVILGLPWGDPEQGSIVINKDGFAVQYNTSIVKLIQRIADNIVPLGGQLVKLFSLDIQDQLSVGFALNGFDQFFSNVVIDNQFPSIDPELDFSAFFSGSLSFLGFDLAAISGAAISPNSSLLNAQTVFQKVYELPAGVSPDPGKIPIATLADFNNLRDLGGMILTGQLFAPEMLIDPAGLIGRMIDDGDFTPPGNPTELPAYLQNIVDLLLEDKELARIQTYIPSFGSIFDVALDSLGAPQVVVLENVETQVQRLMDAAYLRGFLTAQLLSIPLGRATIEATTEGLRAQAVLPWAGNLTAALDIGKVPLNMNELVEDLAAAGGFNVDLTTPGIGVIEVPLPVAAASVIVNAQETAALLAQMLGLPSTIFSRSGNLTANLSLFSPGFDSNIPQIGQNGGIHFDTALDIRNFVSGASAEFNMPLFGGGAVAPNFSASLDIDRLAIPGFGELPPNIFTADLHAGLEKQNDILSMDLDGSINLLGLLDLNAQGDLTIDASINHPGIFGQFELTVAGGGDPSLGNEFFSLDGRFLFQLNTTDQAHDDLPRGPYIRVHIDGSLNVLGIVDLAGVVDLAPNDRGLTLDGEATLEVHFLGVDILETVSLTVTLRRDGRVEGSFDGLGIVASLDRFGCFDSALKLDDGGLFHLPDLPLLPGACDQHVYVDPQSFNERDTDRDRNIRIDLSRPAEQDLEVTYIITPGSATSPGDYTGTLSGTIIIPRDATHGNIPITIKGDTDNEGNESFHIEITKAEYLEFTFVPIAGHIAADWNANLRIVDDDAPENNPPVVITFGPAGSLNGSIQTDAGGRIIFKGSLIEGEFGGIELVAQGLDSQDSVLVHYSLVPLVRSLLTAEEAQDFFAGANGQGVEGYITLIGSLPQTIGVSTLADVSYELNEEFELQFEIVREAAMAPTTDLSVFAARVAITNDDQDIPPGAMVFYDFDDFAGGLHYTSRPSYLDPLLVATDFRHISEVPTGPGSDSPINSSLLFDGNHDHLKATADSGFSLPAGALTIDFWINPGDSTARGTILSLGGALVLSILDGSLGFTMSNTSGGSFSGDLAVLAAGEWQHVTVVYSGSAMIGYVNGVRANSLTAGGTIAYAGQGLRIGTNDLLQESLSARLDEMRLWTTAFSDAQAATLPALSTTGSESNLLINYRFDEGQGVSTGNSTLKGWNAQLGSTLGIFGPFGRPDWSDGGDSPVADFARYIAITRTQLGVPKIPPVDPAAEPTFATLNTGWAAPGTPIDQAPYYKFIIGHDAPADASGLALFRSIVALRIDGVDFFNRAGVDGPTRWELRSSRDGFNSALAQGQTLPGGDFEHDRVIFDEALRLIHPNAGVEFRLYGLDARGDGEWSIDNFALIITTEVPAVFNLRPITPPMVLNVRVGEGSAGFDPLAGAADPDGDPIDIVSFSAPIGSLIFSNGQYFYTPPAGVISDVPLTFVIADQWGATTRRTITAHIVGNAIDESFTIIEDNPVNGNVLGNDRLLPGQVVSISPVGTLPGGVTLNANGNFSFIPPLNSTSQVKFSYLLSGPDWTDIATTTINITPVNDLPTAINRNFTVPEDTTLTINAPGILSGIVDPDGDSLQVFLVSGVARGSLTLNTNGSFTYVPAADDDTSVSFTYTVFDGTSVTNPATVTIDILPANDAPVAVGNSFTVTEDTTLNVAAPGVLGNDTDVEGNSLQAILVSTVAHGSLTLNSNGSFTYTPALNYTGPDSFSYRASDGPASSAPVTVSLNVQAVNDLPVAVNRSFTVNEDTTLNVAAPGLLAGIVDPEGKPVTAVLVSDVSRGRLTFNSNGSFVYVPSGNDDTSDSFTYAVSDGIGQGNTATVTIDILPVNDAPVGVGDSFSTNINTALTVAAPGVLGNDSDAESTSLKTSLITSAAHGTLSLLSNGGFTYTPTTGYSGPDGFIYRVSDGDLSSPNVSVSITVINPNQPPNAVNDTRPAINESTTATPTSTTFTIANILANDTDPEGGPRTVISMGPPSSGTISFSGVLSSSTTVVTYTAPDPNFNGTVTIPYTITDNQGATDSAVISITINPTNDAPVAANNSFSLNLTFNTQLQVFAPGVLGNDSDIDGNPLTAVLVSGTQGNFGSLTSFGSNGSLTYVPFGSNGTDTFTYRARDSAGVLSNLANIIITVSGAGTTTGGTTTIGGHVAYGRLGFDVNRNNIWDFDDVNGNGVRDVGESAEPVADMTRGGTAELNVPPVLDLNGDGQYTVNEGVLLAFNGTNTATLGPLSVPFTAPVGSSVITSFTTVVTALMAEQDFSLPHAQFTVRTAFGLPDFDLTQTNPIAQAGVGDAGSAAYLAAHVQLHNTYAQATAWLVALSGRPMPQVAGQLISALAARLANDPASMDLSDPVDMAGLLSSAASRLGLSISMTDLDTVAAVIAAGNQVAAQPSAGPEDASAFIDSVYRVEAAAQGPIADLLEKFGSGALPAGQLLADATGQALLDLIQSSVLGEIPSLPTQGATLRNLLATATTEGGNTRLSGNITGIALGSQVALLINWDDGMIQEVALPDGATSFTLDHLFIDESPRRATQGARRIGIMLSVDGAPADITSVATNVTNVAPVVQSAYLTPLVIVGGTALLSGTFFDAGGSDSHTVDIDWGDGELSHADLPAGAHTFAQGHSYNQTGAYTVVLRLSDEDGAQTSQSFAVLVKAPTAPVVERFIVDDGSSQRSMVRSLTVVFDQPVDLQAGLLRLTRAGGADYGVSASNPSGDGRTWLLAFFGPDTIGSSLPDGSYTLRIPMGSLKNPLGQQLANDYEARFHRFFGDVDGDRDVDRSDHDRFKQAYGSSEFSREFISALDFNDDGMIDKTDSREFHRRLGQKPKHLE